jgi:hypothetical protein
MTLSLVRRLYRTTPRFRFACCRHSFGLVHTMFEFNSCYFFFRRK